MEKSKPKKKGCAEKAPLNITGQLAMPEKLPPWERNLLAVVLEAVDGSTQQEEKADAGVSS